MSFFDKPLESMDADLDSGISDEERRYRDPQYSESSEDEEDEIAIRRFREEEDEESAW